MEYFNERKALQEHIQYLREERRRLGDEIWKAHERLKQLDEAAQHPEVLEKMYNTVERLEKLLPTMNAVQTIENSELPSNLILDTPEEMEAKISNYEIELEKEKVFRASRMKKGTQTDVKELAVVILNYLKERGIPVKTSEIRGYLEEHGITHKNMTNTMNQVMNYQPKIERVSKGYYQVKSYRK